ncbi:hypothetical protein [Streptomyces sp. AM 2-1-1]|uniref:hypothetical protein n=1 Tax=Streptomyces sp. AM 2-1-1 TaxID=3028709 RepID=UPI0023B95887|nr:hypothetical protein [Streptomyces sp. AM 2-1-1]WEH41116.1 hypothetical protein PZB77_17325 [Streptomyces sp. AM 2-1-1]
MHAFGLRTDQNHLSPCLVMIAALADSLAPRAHQGAIPRILATGPAPARAVLSAHSAVKTGFGSIGVARRTPLRPSRMAEKAGR